MKKFLALLMAVMLSFAFVACSNGSNSGGSANNGNGGDNADSGSGSEYDLPGLELAWHDEFDGNSLNKAYWTCMIGTGTQYGLVDWGNSEAQYYTEDNVRVEDGNLIITARRESMGGKNYTSARLRTANKVSTCYGRIEARISLPAVTGMWPAFWMLPESTTPYGGWPNSGEIDIMEVRGRCKYQTTAAVHFARNGHQYIGGDTFFDDTDITDYHVYALEWTEERMEWFVDDKMFFSVSADRWVNIGGTPPAPFDTDFHILLNMAVGGHFDGFNEPPLSFKSCEMKVDYVRIYNFKH